MDEARCLNPISLITSEELYLIDNPASLNFICDECEVELIPCSYIKDVNLRKPYFRTRPGDSHESGCSAEGDSKIRSKGASSRLTNNEGFPLAYPNKFKLRKDDLIEDANVEVGQINARKNYAKTGSNSNHKINKKHTFETTSFRSIVNQYFDFPFDRDRSLTFEGVNGESYSEVFSRINSTTGKQQFRIQGDERKIYYGVLSWTKAAAEENKIKISLTSGKWGDEDGKPVNERPYYVEVNFNDWPKQTITKFINLYSKSIDLVRGTNVKAVIAFVGKQDTKDDFFRFYAENRLLISIKIFSNEKA